jgi:hypothetical protein
MDLNTFEQFLAANHDGYWEMLATAVGHEHSVRKTEEGLTGDAFKQGNGGLAVSPRMVCMRVDALAAYDPDRLAALSRGWRRPAQMGPDVYDSELDFLDAVWAWSLRFIWERGVVSNEELDTPRGAISRERDVLLARERARTFEWEEIVAGLATGRFDNSTIRTLDKSELLLKEISEQHLIDIATCGTETRLKVGRFRVIRGRESRLTPGAVNFLVSALRTAFGEASDSIHWDEYLAMGASSADLRPASFTLVDAVIDLASGKRTGKAQLESNATSEVPVE